MNLPKVYIAILNWFNYETTIRCVRSVLNSDYKNFEVIIVDNGSRNGSLNKLREAFPNLRILDAGENLGYAAGNKLAVDLAISENADLIWILNNDTTVRQNALTELVRSYEKHGNAIYSNTTLMSESPDIIHYAGSYGPTEESDPENPYDRLKGSLWTEVEASLSDREARIYGQSLLVPTSLVEQYGFMDTEYFLFFEEEDFFKRLATHGVPTIYVKNAIIVHESSGSFKVNGKVDSNLKLLLLYYGKRNRHFFKMRWNDLKRNEIIKSRGGWIPLVKFFVKYWISSNADKARKKEDFFVNLAAVHAFLGIRGRTHDPSDHKISGT